MRNDTLMPETSETKPKLTPSPEWIAKRVTQMKNIAIVKGEAREAMAVRPVTSQDSQDSPIDSKCTTSLCGDWEFGE